MFSEYDEYDKEHRKRIIKKYTILSTSGVCDSKCKTSLKVVVANITINLAILSVVLYYGNQWLNYQAQGDISTMYYSSVDADYTTFETSVTTVQQEVQEVSEPEKPMVLLDGAKTLLAENKDTVGYIKIDGIKVDNVVVQGEDNDFYLNHDFYGKKSQPGTLFVDYRCTINTKQDSDNLIVYGHNQKDGKMFGELDLYKWNQDFWLTHNIIHFNTNYEENDYVIIASFVTNELPEHDNGNVFDYYNYILFNDYYPFDKWYSEIMERTMFWTGIQCTDKDEYITLSTCSSEWEPARHVIIARKLHEGEEVSTEGYVWNTKPKYPQIYYDIFGGSWKGGNN